MGTACSTCKTVQQPKEEIQNSSFGPSESKEEATKKSEATASLKSDHQKQPIAQPQQEAPTPDAEKEPTTPTSESEESEQSQDSKIEGTDNAVQKREVGKQYKQGRISIQVMPHEVNYFLQELHGTPGSQNSNLSVQSNFKLNQTIQSNASSKAKDCVVHRIKRESFIRMSSENVNKKYSFSMKLGQGAYGSVFTAKSKFSHDPRAIKIIAKTKIKAKQQNFLSELMILRTLDHPNIIKLLEVYDNKTYFYVVTEVCSGGDLLQYARKKLLISQKYVCNLMKQLFSAVNYLHKRLIAHRDLKPENILFEETNQSNNSNNVVKIIDFGTACEFTPGVKMKQRVGSPYYVAPEVLKASYTQKCDMWSCGVILYVLLCGAPPFDGSNRKEIFESIVKGKLTFKQQVWRKISREAKDLIRKLLTKNQENRLSAEEALKHPWMALQHDLTNKIDSNQVLKNMENFFFKDRLIAVVKTYVASLTSCQEERRRLAQKFKQIDKDNSGMLEADEILEAYKQMYGVVTENFINDIMQKVDTNGSGKIDFTEFIVAAGKQDKIMCQGALERAFHYFDKDGTGFLQVNEMKQLLGAVQEDEVKNIMAILDQNNDNKISKDEFINHLVEQV